MTSPDTTATFGEMDTETPRDASPLQENSADSRARRAALDLVCRQAARGISLSLFVLTLLCIGLLETVGPDRLLAWTTVAAGVSSVRYAVVLGFRHKSGLISTIGWERIFAGSLVANCLVWGVGCMLLMPDLSAFLQAFTFSFVIGMASGVATIYSAQKMGAYLGVFALAGPVVVWLAAQSGLQQVLMAVCGAAFLISSLWAIRIMGEFVRRASR
jgi:hypothetical protein